MARRLRVALVTRSLITGGAHQQIVKLCQSISPEVVELSLFLLTRDEANELRPGLPRHARVHTSPLRRHHPRVLKWLAGGIRRERAQVAHSFQWHADATAALSRVLFGWGPLVISERCDRGGPSYRRQAGLRHLMDRWATFPASQWTCANSQFGQRLLVQLGVPPNPTTCTLNGVDCARFDAVLALSIRDHHSWPSGCAVVGAVCRLVAYKGADGSLADLCWSGAHPVCSSGTYRGV